MTNLASTDELWFVTRADQQQNLSPSDKECQVQGEAFTCGDLYLGAEGSVDTGKGFRLTFIRVTRGSAAESVLPNHAKQAQSRGYPGIPANPTGADDLTSFDLTRG